jgi:cytochrome c
MKKLALFACLILFISCKKESEEPFGKQEETVKISQTPEQLGKELFEGKGNCVSCHQPNQKIIGPSIHEIATIYKAQNGSIISFLKDDAKPLVDPSQYEVMKTNFAITKTMNHTELSALETYIYSYLK